jgi:Holliday junction resolvase RusA-like endonuclease
MTGVAWADDSQVVDIHSTKRYAEPGEFAGVQVTISPVAIAAAAPQQQELVA